MNDLFVMLGIESWKPVLSSLLLPPVPMLVLVSIGAAALASRRRLGRLGGLLVLLGVAGIWFGACSAVGEGLEQALLSPPPALARERIAQLRQQAAARAGSVAIVVLGGGREAHAPEYGVASLGPYSLERLRFAVWLGRQTGAPVMFSGGLGHASVEGASEAEVAARIAAGEFGRPLRWLEDRSRDTRENAQYAVALLREQPPRSLVIVTHAWHMPRALRAFREASSRAGVGWELIAAPMGLAQRVERPALRWIPSSEGFFHVRAVVRERIGLWLGA